MKHMKNLLITLLTLSMLFTLAACGGEKPAAPPAEDPVDEVEQETVFDFGAYAVEFKDAELTVADHGFDCLMLTLAYTNIDPDETGTLGENIKYTATQNGKELSLCSLSEYWENEPYYVRDGEIVDFHIGFILQLEDNRVYFDMSEIEVVLQDKNSDLSYSFTVDPSVLDASALSAGTGEEAGETEGFGDFESILVPQSFTLKRDSWNEDNPHYASVVNTDSDWIYIKFNNFTDEDEMNEDYEYDKENCSEEMTDVSANYGGIEWTGFQYDDGYGNIGFEAYAVIGGNYLRVSSASLTFDDGIVQAVLGSVVMAQ